MRHMSRNFLTRWIREARLHQTAVATIVFCQGTHTRRATDKDL